MDQARHLALSRLDSVTLIFQYPSSESCLSSSPPATAHNHEELREDSWQGKLTIGELVLFVVVAAIGLRVLPRPLDLLAATSLPAIYFPARIDPRLTRPIALMVLVGIMLVAFLPAWYTDESSDLILGKVGALAFAPLLARIATWRCRSEAWDFLDPLVIATAPLAFTTFFAVAARLLELGILTW